MAATLGVFNGAQSDLVAGGEAHVIESHVELAAAAQRRLAWASVTVARAVAPRLMTTWSLTWTSSRTS